jgi:hypothetical protein
MPPQRGRQKARASDLAKRTVKRTNERRLPSWYKLLYDVGNLQASRSQKASRCTTEWRLPSWYKPLQDETLQVISLKMCGIFVKSRSAPGNPQFWLESDSVAHRFQLPHDLLGCSLP